MRFKHGRMLKMPGKQLMTEFEAAEVVVLPLGRSIVRGKGKDDWFQAECTVEPGGILIGDRVLIVRMELARPPTRDARPVRSVAFEFWDEDPKVREVVTDVDGQKLEEREVEYSEVMKPGEVRQYAGVEHRCESSSRDGDTVNTTVRKHHP